MRDKAIKYILNQGKIKSRRFLDRCSDKALANILLRSKENNFDGRPAYDQGYQELRGFVNKQLLLTTFSTL